MKRRALIVSISILVILSSVAIYGYRYFFGTNEELKAQIIDEFGEDFFRLDDLDIDEDFEEDVSKESTKETEKNESIEEDSKRDTQEKTEQNAKLNDNPKIVNSSEKEKLDSTKSHKDNGNIKETRVETKMVVTKDQIANKYMPRFERLQSTSMRKIDELIIKGYNEYKDNKDKEDFSRAALAKKYIQAMSILEKSVNNSFNELLSEMEKELKRHQLPLDPVKEAKEAYKQAIGDKKSEMYKRYGGSM